MLEARAISLKEANEFVYQLHRHHDPVHRDKFRVAAFDGERLCGVVQIGRPTSRHLDNGQIVEVLRCCTDETKNACSFLYSRAAQAAKALGFERIITYILVTESGASLKAAGWKRTFKTRGHSWDCPSRRRNTTAPTADKWRWERVLKEDLQ